MRRPRSSTECRCYQSRFARSRSRELRSRSRRSSSSIVTFEFRCSSSLSRKKSLPICSETHFWHLCQKWSGLPHISRRARRFEQPFSGKARLGGLLFYSVLSNANIPSQISRHRNVSRSQGNVAWIVPTIGQLTIGSLRGSEL